MIYVNGEPLVVTIFPDNTSQIWNLPETWLKSTEPLNVLWDFQQESEFIHLAQLKTLLDNEKVKSNLQISYLPYARQDKEISNNLTFGLRTFASLLNNLSFSEIVINDPHSEVALELINNSRAEYPESEVEKILDLTQSQILCYPDKGARLKYSKIYQHSFIYGEKVRDQASGLIKSYALVGECEGKKVLIVDDICDGGATFILLAQELLKSGAKEVNLFVSHGLFSKGLRPILNSGIKRIFTSDGEVSEYQHQIIYRRL